MNALEARGHAKNWLEKTTKENNQWNDARKKKEDKAEATLWKKRGPELTRRIDGYIKKAALGGYHSIYEPSDINPGGDPIIWLGESDYIIHQTLIKHYRDKGFKVEEYTPYALKITW
jgi:hypothetical protein